MVTQYVFFFSLVCFLNWFFSANYSEIKTTLPADLISRSEDVASDVDREIFVMVIACFVNGIATNIAIVELYSPKVVNLSFLDSVYWSIPEEAESHVRGKFNSSFVEGEIFYSPLALLSRSSSPSVLIFKLHRNHRILPKRAVHFLHFLGLCLARRASQLSHAREN